MATYENYDLEDSDIRALVATNHRVTEQRLESGDNVSLTVICCQCKTPWPCRIVTDLRAWELTQPPA